MRKQAFLWATGLVLSVFFVTAGLIYYLSDDRIKSLIENQGNSRLERKLTIDGDVDVQWDWKTPRIYLGKIRLANLPGATDPYMIEIDQVIFNIKIWRLLLGRAEIPELKITKAKIILEKNEKGEKNWSFPDFSQAGTATDAALPDDRHDFPVVDELTVEDGILIYRDKAKDLDGELSLNTVFGKNKKTFTLKGDGTLQDKKFKLDAHGGSIEFLRDSHASYPLRFSLEMGDTMVLMEGRFKDPVKMTGIDATLNLRGHNLADLFYLTSIPLAPTPPYTLTGHLTKEGHLWDYRDFKGTVGDSDLSGTLIYDTSGERGMVKAELVSKFLDMDDLGGFIGMAPSAGRGEAAAPEQKAQAQKENSSPRLLPDVPINLERLRTTDMRVHLMATRINAPGWPMQDMNVVLRLDNGLLRLDPLKFGVSDGRIEGVVQLDGRRKIPDINLDVALTRLSLKGFFKDTRYETLSTGRFGGRIDLKGRGKSLAEILAVSDGRIGLVMSGGTISLLIIESAGIDIAESIPLLLGEDQTTDIRCAVGDFKVTNGVLHSDVFVFDTTDTNIEGEALIDLRDETIDARIQAHPKDQSPLTAKTPIRITGRLKSPQISLDAGELGARGIGAAILGAVFPPAAIIPFIEFGLGEDSDCRELIVQTRAQAGVGKNTH